MEIFTVIGKFFADIWNFINSLLPYPLNYIQVGIIIVLAALLVVSVVIAIINPGKKRRAKIAREKQLKDDIESKSALVAALEKRIESLTEENEKIRNAAQEKTEKAKNEEKLLSESDGILIETREIQIAELNARQAEINSAAQKKGKSAKRADEESVKAELEELSRKKDKLIADKERLTGEKNKRKADLDRSIAEIKSASDAEISKNDAEKAECENRINKLKGELAELNEERCKYDKPKSEKQLKKERQAEKAEREKAAEIEAMDELGKAKYAYLQSVKERERVEREKNLAIDGAKNAEKDKELIKQQKQSDIGASGKTQAIENDDLSEEEHVTETPDENNTVSLPFRNDDEPDFSEKYEDENSEEDGEQLEFEESVVFTDATHLAVNSEIDENTETEDPVSDEQTVMTFYENGNETEASISGLTVGDEKLGKNHLYARISVSKFDADEQTEEDYSDPVPVQDEPKSRDTAHDEPKQIAEPKSRAARINPKYEGIPATPINKKSKYQKPVTKTEAKDPNKKSVLSSEKAKTAAPVAKKAVNTVKEPKTDPTGKWQIAKTDDGFRATLISESGKPLIKTGGYSSVSGLKSAVASINKNRAEDGAEIYVNKQGKFVVRILSASGKDLVAGEEFEAKYQCDKTITLAKRAASNADFTE